MLIFFFRRWCILCGPGTSRRRYDNPVVDRYSLLLQYVYEHDKSNSIIPTSDGHLCRPRRPEYYFMIIDIEIIIIIIIRIIPSLYVKCDILYSSYAGERIRIDRSFISIDVEYYYNSVPTVYSIAS